VADPPPGEASPLPRQLDLISRRQLLRRSALGVVGSTFGLTALAGCHRSSRAAPAPTRSASTPASSPRAAAPSPSPRPPAVVGHVAAAETALLAAYDAAAVTHPGYAAPLAVLRDHHRQHLRALDPAAPIPSPTPSASSPVSSGSVPVSSAAPSVPTAAQTIAGLVALEREAAASRLDDAAKATGSLARLIASIGGCEASHVVALEGLT
jgi:hypothetical protein